MQRGGGVIGFPYCKMAANGAHSMPLASICKCHQRGGGVAASLVGSMPYQNWSASGGSRCGQNKRERRGVGMGGVRLGGGSIRDNGGKPIFYPSSQPRSTFLGPLGLGPANEMAQFQISTNVPYLKE